MSQPEIRSLGTHGLWTARVAGRLAGRGADPRALGRPPCARRRGGRLPRVAEPRRGWPRRSDRCGTCSGFGVRVASSRDRAGGGLALGQTRASAQTRPSGEWHETGQAMDTERRPSSCALQASVRCRPAGSGRRRLDRPRRAALESHSLPRHPARRTAPASATRLPVLVRQRLPGLGTNARQGGDMAAAGRRHGPG